MKIERDERRFDFHDIGLAIKRAREASGMTQEQLAYIVDRAPRTIMYNENDGQHPSLNTFYQMVTMFDISVDQYFYPSKRAWRVSGLPTTGLPGGELGATGLPGAGLEVSSPW